MSTRVTILRDLIHQHRSAGILPQEIHMCEKTRKEFVQEAAIKPERVADTRSFIQRALTPKITQEVVLRFEGVLLVTNPAIGEGGMLLRPLQLMRDPNWLDTIQWAQHEAKITAAKGQESELQGSGDTPWHQRVAIDQASPTGGIMADLTDGGGVNPTTVLLKAMDGLDKIEDVVVLRFYKGGAIDLCATMNKYGVVGALQAAIGHVMNGDE